MSRRILLLITDLEIGGTPTVVRELATRLNDPPGVVVEVACLKGWGPVADQLRDAGVSVAAFGTTSPVQIFSAVRKLRRLVREREIDTVFSFLIHANAVAALSSGRLKGVRFLQSIQTTQDKPAWHWWLQAKVQRSADCIVVPTRSVVLRATRGRRMPEEKFLVIPNALDPRDFADVAPPSATSPLPIGFIGRLDPVKRVPDLLRAVAKLKGRVVLHVFGDGAERPALERLVDDLGIREHVLFHGTIARPQEALRQMNVLVLPSEAEGFGLVLIEAMAAGIPVVARCFAPGVQDVVRDGVTGILTVCFDRAIDALVEKPWLREQMGAAGREEVRSRYSWDVVLPQYRRLLDLQPQS
jgi:glycosyltransferase involved in cell wall biosynthesis